jgi:hypothetical protein
LASTGKDKRRFCLSHPMHHDGAGLSASSEVIRDAGSRENEKLLNGGMNMTEKNDKNDKKEQQTPENLVFEERLHNVRVTIWENRDKEGKSFYNVNVSRRYQSGQGEWSNSNYYTGLGDIALLKAAVALAEDWLRQRTLGAVANASVE